MSSFLDRDLYPKFLIRLPNQSSIWAAQGIQRVVDNSSCLQEKAIVTAPFESCSWEAFNNPPLCWIPQESTTLGSYREIPHHENLNLTTYSKEEIPDHSSWILMIEEIKRRFSISSLQKLVASRQSILKIADCSPLQALAFLFSKTSLVQNRAAIAFMPSADHLFFSMSPERLFSARGNEVMCDLVAGTFPYEKTSVSSKEIAENDFVLADLQEQLITLSSKTTHLSSLKKVVSGNLYHLRRTLKLTLDQNPDYLMLADLLHPTAAICGFPREESKQALRELEFVSRGYFAGYMGVISSDTADLFVAIRSALIEKTAIRLFAGAGIVFDSDPQKEWEELNLKINPYLEMLFANTTTHPLSC